jgi:predicted GIY-YIG superfamily endonuclease
MQSGQFSKSETRNQIYKPMGFYVYILESCRNGTLYIGMTDDLVRRIWEQSNRGGSRLHPQVRRQNAGVV